MDWLSYMYLGDKLDYDQDILEWRDFKRVMDEEMSALLPDFIEIQDDE